MHNADMKVEQPSVVLQQTVPRTRPVVASLLVVLRQNHSRMRPCVIKEGVSALVVNALLLCVRSTT